MQAVQKSLLGPIKTGGRASRQTESLLVALRVRQWQTAKWITERMATSLEQHRPALQDALRW